MMPDDLGPLGGPLAALSWAALLLPPLFRYIRAIRASRKANR